MLRPFQLPVVVVLVLLVIGCDEQTAAPPPPQGSAVSHGAPSERRMRAQLIRAAQDAAGPSYDLYEVDDDALEAEVGDRHHRVGFDSSGMYLRMRTRVEATFRVHVEEVSCNGAWAPAGAASLTHAGNRAAYTHALPSGSTLDAWYTTGPLGIEQGFTLGGTSTCQGQVEVRLRFEHGSIRPTPTGDTLVITTADGEQLTYSDLYVEDASGRELSATMTVHDDVVTLGFDARGARYPIAIDPLFVVQQQKISSSKNFTNSIAVSGNRAVMGNAVNGVEIFLRTNTTWALEATLPVTYSAGTDVAISGDTVLVGASNNTTPAGTEAGAAYVFRRVANTWTQEAYLTASDGAGSNYFGSSVALAGDVAVIGAPFASPPTGSQAGKAYVFTRVGNVWTEEAKLVPPETGVSQFGTQVATDGTSVLAGTVCQNAGNVAYLFARNGTLWPQQAKLVGGPSCIGIAVAVDGATAVVGSPREVISGQFSDVGAAYVFTRSGSTWSQQARLQASDWSQSDQFGRSVALQGDVLAVGAWIDDNASGQDAGSVYLFKRSGVMWSQDTQLFPTPGEVNEQFGTGLASTPSTLLVSAPGEDVGAFQDRGVVYAFLVGDQFPNGSECAVDAQCASTYCNNNVCSVDPILPNGSACTVNGQCATNQCVDGVCCDAACAGACMACSVAAGAAVNGTCGPIADPTLAATEVCRAQMGACDVQETCITTSTSCPFNQLAPSTLLCRPAAGPCDVDDHCSGSSANCFDSFAPATLDCRPASDVCDAVEKCTGSSATCPTDQFLSSAAVCRSATDACDAAEHCTGASPQCPQDQAYGSQVICRASVSACDAQEVCGTAGKACPPDAALAEGTQCGAAPGGACDLQDTCVGLVGASATCSDNVLASAVPCRVSVGPCDAAEACDGIGHACPPDAAQPPGSPCGAAPMGACDVQDTCAGALGATAVCQNKVLGAGASCRPSLSPCDAAEKCDGVGPNCPPDLAQTVGTPCNGAPVGECDTQDTCVGAVGATATCKANAVSAGVGCSDGLDCTVSDACDGVGACLGNSKDCNDHDACTQDGCAEVGGCSHEPVVCDDKEECTTDSCDKNAGCMYTKVADDQPCAKGVCSDGKCVGGGEGGAGGQGSAASTTSSSASGGGGGGSASTEDLSCTVVAVKPPNGAPWFAWAALAVAVALRRRASSKIGDRRGPSERR